MPVFPVIIKPNPDELLYSYLRRLAEACLEPSYYKFLNAWLRGTQRQLRDNSQLNRYDTAFNVSNLFAAMLDISPEYAIEFYMNHSIYSFCAPLWAEYQRVDWILNQFRTMRESELVPHVHTDLVGSLRYCPVCMKEEMVAGVSRYYHRSHNLPGVSACWKHKTKLLSFSGKAGDEMTQELPMKTETCTEWEIRYAEFAKEFCEEKIVSNLNVTAAAIRDKINEIGVEERILRAYMSEDSTLEITDEIISHALRMRKEAGVFQKRAILSRTLTVIVLLFRNVQEFKKYVHYNSRKEDFEEALKKLSCEMISDYNDELVVVHHGRCKPFFTSPEAVINGWGCPTCDDLLPTEKLFRKIFEFQKGDEYSLLGDFEGLKTPVLVRHNECGTEYAQMPVKLIKRNIPCKCHLDVNNIERAKKWLADHYPQFEIISFTDMTEAVTLFCNDCMNTSTYPDFYYFMDHPRCRCCQPATYSQERIEETIRDLVGDEYTLVTPFTTMHDSSSVFRHNICGTEFKCAPVHFIRGIRCHKCKHPMSMNELNTYLMTATHKKYEIISCSPMTSNYYEVRNNATGQTRFLLKEVILQELHRPTPSMIFELDDESVGINSDQSVSDLLDDYLKNHPVFIKDDFRAYCGDAADDSFDGTFTALVIQRKIKEIHRGSGIYCDYNTSMSLEEMIERTLLHDADGNTIGYWSGSSFLKQFGIKPKTDELILISNRYAGRYKAHATMLGRRVTISGPQYGMVTNENWKFMCLLSWTISPSASKEPALMNKLEEFSADAKATASVLEVAKERLGTRAFGKVKTIINTLHIEMEGE